MTSRLNPPQQSCNEEVPSTNIQYCRPGRETKVTVDTFSIKSEPISGVLPNVTMHPNFNALS